MPRTVVWIVCLLAVLGGGCGGEEDLAAVAVPATLHWAKDAQAQRYQVRAWSGLRLIFEQTVTDTILELTPSMHRGMAAFDSVRIRVRAVEPGGQREILQQLWPPPP